MIFFISILFVLFMTIPIATGIAKRVPDEIEAAGQYLAMGPDALLLVIIGLFLYTAGFPTLALIVPAVLILVRYFTKLDPIYSILTGLALGLSFRSEIFITLCLIVLAFNYTWGLLGERWKLGIWQPVAAVLVLIGTPWLHLL